MAGFLSKLFRRKKTTASTDGSSSKKKEKKAGKKGKKDKGKEKSLLRDVNPARAAAPAENDLPRNGSFGNTSRTGGGSNSSREKEAELSKNASFGKPQEQTRVLSPRINTRDGTSRASSRVDEMQFPHDENLEHSNSLSSSVSPRLSYQQLQQFERQQYDSGGLSPSRPMPSSGSQPTFAMSAELPRQQISAMDDMNRSDASSSSFNLSTDAEDSEYEHMRRVGVLPGGVNTSSLDTSAMSQASLPTAYTTDDDRIFPALQTDDDMTQATAPSTNEPSVHQPQGLLVPLSTPDDEPGRIQIFPAIFPMNNETEADLRAWTFSPSTQASKDLPSAKSASSHQRFNFEGASSLRETIATPKNSSATPQASSSRNAPGAAHRNFTSPKSHTSSNTDFSNNDFANFADFSNFTTTTDIQPWSDEKTDPKPSPSTRDNGNGFDSFTPRSQGMSSTSSAAKEQDSSLSELLAQAKNKRRGNRSSRTSRPSSSSVNSAPAITASYLRQHHGLGRHSGNSAYGERSERESRTSNEGTSVSDIIHSLEATNQSRMKTTNGRNTYSHRSVGDTGAANTANVAKERLREKRRREREYNASMGLPKSRSSENSSSENSDNEASESWLFDEVTGALGPRGIAADLESLSGRSNRSKNSQGNKSHKSHKSRSRRSRGSSRRHRSSNESVDSRGSRHSRNSRYSHRSTKSFISQMSEQSRSVANDLLRLEMQLAMVGSQENRDDAAPVRGSGSVAGGASIGGASRASRTSRKSLTSHRTHSSSIARRSKATVVAPPGKLGIILANKADSKGTVVSGVRTSSVLADKISPGDRIIGIDGEDVSRMTVSEITTIMSRKSDYERTLTVLTTPKNHSGAPEAMPHRSPVKASPDQFDNSFQQYRR